MTLRVEKPLWFPFYFVPYIPPQTNKKVMLFFVLVMENEKKHGRYDIKFTMGNFNLSGQKKQVVSEK
ncbi:hypothetical protein K110096F8_28320 [Dielma fastidiosa]